MVGFLVATEKSPLVKSRALAHKVNFYPVVDFVHLYYLNITKFLCPFRASVVLTVIDRLNSSTNHFGFFTTRFGLSAAILILQFVSLLDMRGSKFSQTRGPAQPKNRYPPLWGKTLICDTLFLSYCIILYLGSTSFFFLFLFV